jgi:hypothetical protein
MEYHNKINNLDLEVLKDAFTRLDSVWDSSRELDCRICYALGLNWVDSRMSSNGETSWRHHIERNGYKAAWVNSHVLSYDDVPRITSDLSAAYRMLHLVLPSHDDISISRDPSGVGAVIGNWYLSHPDGPTIMEYANVVHCLEPMALMSAILKVVIGIKSGASETDTQYRERTKRPAPEA